MTERLSALLHEELDLLDVPPPAAAAVLARGRSLRRRRRAVVALAGVSTAAVVGLGFAVVGGDGGDRAVDPAAPASGAGPVFSVGAEVYLDGGAIRATVEDTVVKSLYYSSAGVVVRHGENPNSDGGGPQRFSLVAPDGTVSRLGENHFLITTTTAMAAEAEVGTGLRGALDIRGEQVVHAVARGAEGLGMAGQAAIRRLRILHALARLVPRIRDAHDLAGEGAVAAQAGLGRVDRAAQVVRRVEGWRRACRRRGRTRRVG